MSRWTSWDADKVLLKMREETKAATLEAAEAILELSQAQVPLQDGDLMRSGIVVPQKNGSVAISYGGGVGTGQSAIPYAKRWHEDPANFQKGRKRHYLRDPAFIQGPALLLAALQKHSKKGAGT